MILILKIIILVILQLGMVLKFCVKITSTLQLGNF
jgi:hypothetical protein